MKEQQEAAKVEAAALNTAINDYHQSLKASGYVDEVPYWTERKKALKFGFNAGIQHSRLPAGGGKARGIDVKTDDIITLADRLAAYEEAMTETNDIRGFGWHVQRRRENDRVEWFSSDSQGRVFGPFDTTLEAFAALKGETNNGRWRSGRRSASRRISMSNNIYLAKSDLTGRVYAVNGKSKTDVTDFVTQLIQIETARLTEQNAELAEQRDAYKEAADSALDLVTANKFTYDEKESMNGLVTKLGERISELAEQNRLLVEAVKHYADESFWDDFADGEASGYANGTIYNFMDEVDGQLYGYTIAQAALAAIEGGEK